VSLTKYREKRDFKATPEPKGASHPESSAKDLSFVVQKHQARLPQSEFARCSNGYEEPFPSCPLLQ